MFRSVLACVLLLVAVSATGEKLQSVRKKHPRACSVTFSRSQAATKSLYDNMKAIPELSNTVSIIDMPELAEVKRLLMAPQTGSNASQTQARP